MTNCPHLPTLVYSKEVRRLARGGQLSAFEAMALMRKVMMTSLSVEKLLPDEDDSVLETEGKMEQEKKNSI